MNQNNDTQTEASNNLRSRAESILQEKSSSQDDVSKLSLEQLQAIVHELQVHQIELELQNKELREAQQELSTLMDDYVDLYDFAPVGYLTLNNKGLISKANLTAAKMLAVDREMLLKQPLSKLVSPEDRDKYYLNNSRTINDLVHHSFELRLIRSDSTSFDAELRVEPIVDINGDFKEFRLIVLDITSRKRAEQELLQNKKDLEKIVDYRTAELKESRDLFRALFERAGVGVALIDALSGKFIRTNQKYCDIVGYSRDELRQMNFQVITHPADLDADMANMKLLQDGKVSEFSREKRFIHRDGSIAWVSLTVSPMWRVGVPPNYSIAVVHDITKRKKAEEALVESETRYRTIFEGANEGILVAEAGTMRFKYANPTMATLLGYTLDELVGLSIEDIHPEEILPDIIGKFERHLSGLKIKDEAIPVRKKDGTIIHCDITTALMKIDDVMCAVGFFSDITDRIQAERALRQSEERYRLVADFTHDWEYWMDSEGKFLWVSPSCERITGYAAKEFMDDPKLIDKIVHPDDLKRVLEHYNKALKTDYARAHSEDFRIINRSGDIRWIAHVCQPVFDQSGAPLGRRASNRDVTDRKDLEQQFLQSQKMEAIGTLAGGIAHDFNNLLFGMMGYTELAMAEVSPHGPTFEKMRHVIDAGKRAADLINQILLFSRKGVESKKPLYLGPIVKEGLKFLRASIPANIRFNEKISPESHRVLADPTQIYQVLMNLCSNAAFSMKV